MLDIPPDNLVVPTTETATISARESSRRYLNITESVVQVRRVVESDASESWRLGA